MIMMIYMVSLPCCRACYGQFYHVNHNHINLALSSLNPSFIIFLHMLWLTAAVSIFDLDCLQALALCG